jgi:hypothetical protein
MGPGSRFACPGRRGVVSFEFNCQTARGRASAFSRRDAPELCVDCRPRKNKRAQGKPDARCTRGLVCKMHIEKRTRAYRFSGGNPAFPAQWFTAYFALLVTGLSCHRHPGEVLLPANLTPASGRQDHTTSPSATATFVIRRHRVHRIPPHVRDDREPPLSSGETGEARSLICPDGLSGIFFSKGLDRFWVICPSDCFVAARSRDFARSEAELVGRISQSIIRLPLWHGGGLRYANPPYALIY